MSQHLYRRFDLTDLTATPDTIQVARWLNAHANTFECRGLVYVSVSVSISASTGRSCKEDLYPLTLSKSASCESQYKARTVHGGDMAQKSESRASAVVNGLLVASPLLVIRVAS